MFLKIKINLSCQVRKKSYNKGYQHKLNSEHGNYFKTRELEYIPIFKDLNNQNNLFQGFQADFIKNIMMVANTKKIKLKMFTQQIEKLRSFSTEFERNAFMTAAELLQDLIIEGEIPIFNNGTYQTSLGRSYIRRGEKGFDHFYSFIEVIYEHRCLFDMSTTTDIYIGHTEKGIRKRFEYEIENGINEYKKLGELPSRLIEQAILIAIEKEVSSVGVKIYGIENKKYNDLDHFLSVYLTVVESFRLDIRKQLADSLLNNYFETNILEKHYTKINVCDREKWYKENYPDSYGTVYPNGLNMNSNVESVRKYIVLPMYDIMFMLSLGYRIPKISKLLKKLYGIKEASEDNVYARIAQFFYNVENAENKFLKPVVQVLLENYPDLSGDQIGKIIHRKGGRQFFDSQGCPFKRWFGDLKLRELKKVIALNDFNWNKIDYLLEEIKKGNCIKGIHKAQWIKFFTKGISNKKLAKFGGYKSADSFRKHFFELEESKKAFGVSNRKEAIKKYRRLKTIAILKDTLSPSLLTFENIYTNIFGFQSRQKYISKYKKNFNNGEYLFERSLSNYFKALFDGMPLQEIIEVYRF